MFLETREKESTLDVFEDFDVLFVRRTGIFEFKSHVKDFFLDFWSPIINCFVDQQIIFAYRLNLSEFFLTILVKIIVAYRFDILFKNDWISHFPDIDWFTL